MRVAVDMRLKLDAVFLQLSEFREAKDLETAGVGQDRAVPAHELVETSEFLDRLVSGPEHQVICIPQNNLRPEFFQIIDGHGLDRGIGADGHENRRFEGAVGGVNGANARRRHSALWRSCPRKSKVLIETII